MTASTVLYIIAVAAAVILLIKIIGSKIKKLFKFLLHALLGLVLLWLANFFGLEIEINAVKVILSGIFGVPAVIVIIVCSML